jgi:hypothetical protein
MNKIYEVNYNYYDAEAVFEIDLDIFKTRELNDFWLLISVFKKLFNIFCVSWFNLFLLYQSVKRN